MINRSALCEQALSEVDDDTLRRFVAADHLASKADIARVLQVWVDTNPTIFSPCEKCEYVVVDGDGDPMDCIIVGYSMKSLCRGVQFMPKGDKL